MVQKLFAAVGRALSRNGWDLISVAGLGLSAWGLAWWIHPGAGLVTGGVGLLALGVFGAYVRGRP